MISAVGSGIHTEKLLIIHFRQLHRPLLQILPILNAFVWPEAWAHEGTSDSNNRLIKVGGIPRILLKQAKQASPWLMLCGISATFYSAGTFPKLGATTQ